MTTAEAPRVPNTQAVPKAHEPVRGDGYLFRYKGSAVWWGKYYIPGNPTPQRFSTGERDERKAAKVLRKRTGAVRNGEETRRQNQEGGCLSVRG